MPRKADSALEGRILDASYHLWMKGGEKALTMRAVARAAKTTTPTVYERFRDKREILESLRRRALQRLYETLESAEHLDQFPSRYLDFAIKHPHEYRLIHTDWVVRLARPEPRPSFELLKRRLAERLGGEPAAYGQLALSLAALAHGIAVLLLTEGVKEPVVRSLREACSSGFDALVEHAGRENGSRKRT
jgi:AcrR family transcriptional regulator